MEGRTISVAVVGSISGMTKLSAEPSTELVWTASIEVSEGKITDEVSELSRFKTGPTIGTPDVRLSCDVLASLSGSGSDKETTGIGVDIAIASPPLKTTKEPLVGTAKSGAVTDVGTTTTTPSVLADTKTGSIEVGFNAAREGDTMLYVAASEMVSTPAKSDWRIRDVGSDEAMVASISVTVDGMLSEGSKSPKDNPRVAEMDP